MEEVTAKELNVLSLDTPFSALEYQLKKPHKLPSKLVGTVQHLWPLVNVGLVTTSQVAWLKHGVTCSKGDVVLLDIAHGTRKWTAGKLQLHLDAGQPMCLVSLFECLEIGARNEYAVWQSFADQSAAISLCKVLTPCLYAQNGAKITTLIPLPWR